LLVRVSAERAWLGSAAKQYVTSFLNVPVLVQQQCCCNIKVYDFPSQPVEEWYKDTPALIYAKYTLGFSFNYMLAVNKYIPG
jgi:hypothetical protein